MMYIIVNPKSRTGKGLQIWKEAREILKKNNIEFKAYATKYKGHATKLAEQITSLSDDEICLVVVGGDGTVNEVLNGIRDFSKVRFGVVPTGSGNDFARGLQMKGNTAYYVDRIMDGTKTRTMDLGRVTWDDCEKPRYFAISSGIGMDAIVCKKALTSKQKEVLNKLHLGKLTYLLLTVETLFSMETANIKACLDGKNKKLFDKLIFAAAMNFRAEGGGVPMAPNADAEDGKLSMCFAYGIPKWLTFLVLPFLVLAKHEMFSCFSIEDCRDCHIQLDRPVVLHADGEYLGDVMDVRFECVPKALKIMI